MDENTEVRERLKARIGEGWYRGISTGPGWDDILDRLDREIAEINPDYEIHQVKEKFGGLRYYCDGDGAPQIQEAIRRAEVEAAKTCEACGEPGSLRRTGRGWYLTTCDQHAPDGSELVDHT